jgi:hypothetical protein
MRSYLKHLAPAFAFLIFGRIFSYSIYSLIFYPDLTEYMRLYRDVKSWQWPLLLPFDFAIGFIFSVSYSWLLKNTNRKICPFRFALFYVFVTRVMGELLNYILFPISFKVIIGGCVVGTCTFLCTAFVLKVINKEKSPKSSPA